MVTHRQGGVSPVADASSSNGLEAQAAVPGEQQNDQEASQLGSCDLQNVRLPGAGICAQHIPTDHCAEAMQLHHSRIDVFLCQVRYRTV